MEELGGATTHTTRSGWPTSPRTRTKSACCCIRELLSYMPQNNLEDPPLGPTDDDPHAAGDESSIDIVPVNPNQPYDMRDVIRPRGRRRPAARGARALRRRTSWSGSRRSAAARSASSATSPPCWPAARHRRLGQGRPLRALLRRLQHPAGDLRRRARLPARHARRSTAASSATAPSCCTPSARPPCPRSR